jgi:hypothetical protein
MSSFIKHTILVRYNPRRHARRAEAAKVRIEFSDGSSDVLWMSERDIKANIKEYGSSQGFTDALEAYKANQKFPPTETGVVV